MNIALIGYGKMGKAVEALAGGRGHKVGVVVDSDEQWHANVEALRRCDVAVDFSTPASAVANIRRCFDINLPVVVGTTGWYDHLDEIKAECETGGHSLFVASNFSIGMNIVFELNRRLASLMNGQPGYGVSIDETHHIHKLDAPSGTAISLANDIVGRVERLDAWQLAGEGVSVATGNLPITSHRIGEVPGIHTVTYDSAVDTISLTHSAKGRQGFALGALVAAEFLHGRNGYFTMCDLLKVE